MTLDAPEPIAAYLAAEEAKDADAVSAASPKTGTVHRRGADYRGRDAIRQWKQAAGREIPIRSRDGQRQTMNEVTVRARTHRRVPWIPLNWTTFQTFQQQDCFAGDSIMTMTYLSPFSADEFEGSGFSSPAAQGYGTGYGAPFYSERRFRRNDCTLAAAGRAGGCSLRTDGYRYAAGVQECNQSHSAGVGWDSNLVNMSEGRMLRTADTSAL